MIAKALAKSAGSSLALMLLLVNGETSSAPDVVGGAGEECLVVQGLPLQVQLNTGASGKPRAFDTPVTLLRGAPDTLRTLVLRYMYNIWRG